MQANLQDMTLLYFSTAQWDTMFKWVNLVVRSVLCRNPLTTTFMLAVFNDAIAHRLQMMNTTFLPRLQLISSWLLVASVFGSESECCKSISICGLNKVLFHCERAQRSLTAIMLSEVISKRCQPTRAYMLNIDVLSAFDANSHTARFWNAIASVCAYPTWDFSYFLMKRQTLCVHTCKMGKKKHEKVPCNDWQKEVMS